jgi:hypothetical protein
MPLQLRLGQPALLSAFSCLATFGQIYPCRSSRQRWVRSELGHCS